MSMLAEPRYKQKLSVDPRGSHWSKDESKFGQKMLEKFGWSKGKGLGAKEDGHVDHIKVSVKNNNHGLGCSKSQVDNWIAHQDDFNALLANLNQSNEQKDSHNQSNEQKDSHKVISLENKSKTSRSRVHYQKFTKGKDLSAKSSEDLDCIFGRRKTRVDDNTPSDSPDEEENKTVNDPNLGGFVTVRSEENIQDYFAKKMASLKNSRSSNQPELQSILKCQVTENASDHSNDSLNKSLSKRVSFMLGDDNSDENKSCENDENESLDSKKSKKKKSKKRKREESEHSEHAVTEMENTTLENEKVTLDVKSASKKRKKAKLDFLEHGQDAVDNINKETSEGKSNCIGQEENCSKKEKKRKKERMSCETMEENVEENLDLERKKKKKVHENEMKDVTQDSNFDIGKRRKKEKKSELADQEGIELKKIKKKKKEKIDCEEEKTKYPEKVMMKESESTEIKDENLDSDNKKKKTSKKEVDQIILDDSEKNVDSIDENNVMSDKIKSKIDGKFSVKPTKEGLKLITAIKDFREKNVSSEKPVKRKKSKETLKKVKSVKKSGKQKPVEVKVPKLIEDIEQSFKGSNISAIEGYANVIQFEFDIKEKLKRKAKLERKRRGKK